MYFDSNVNRDRKKVEKVAKTVIRIKMSRTIAEAFGFVDFELR